MINKIAAYNTINKTEYVYITQKSSVNNYTPFTGLAYNTSGLKAYYMKTGLGSTSISLVDQTSNGLYTAGGFCEIDSTSMPGIYRLDLPNEMFVGNYLYSDATLTLSGANNMYPLVIRYALEPSIVLSSVGMYNRILSQNEVTRLYESMQNRLAAKRSYIPLGTIGNPVFSGYVLKQLQPSLPSGYYYIKNPNMPSALNMYVDMTYEDGGYDFYPITGGQSIFSYGQQHSGTNLGLDLIYPRSQLHWQCMYNFVVNVLGSSVGTYFATTQAVYRSTSTVGGNYSTYIMRDPVGYGTGAPDWKVPDGGRWWLRDSTYGEPNGDYSNNVFLGLSNFTSTASNLLFNDVPQGYYTGTSYLVSTNAKP